MYVVRGTPVNINGRTGGSPGPATTTAVRVPMPVPAGRAKLSNPAGPQLIAPSTTFARYIRIRNLDATNNLLVNFLDGSQITVLKSSEEEFSGTISWIVVQASAATVQWEAHAIVA